ncbi:hypothetical protein [Halovivax sp.]|uniref:hypothetical protein n=1 Tax=Halovivax sp. TaxID=1935978 RepID=UPI0025BF16AC|nr:hypothetical protein [Halovivax sp.]
MTNRPKLVPIGERLVPGLLALALFGALAAVALTTSFEEFAGFPDGISVTAEIGYAMFDYGALQSNEGNLAQTEPFLIAFLLIAIVLDAALDGSLVLATREEDGETPHPAAYDRPVAGGAGTAVTDGGDVEARLETDAADREGATDGGEDA